MELFNVARYQAEEFTPEPRRSAKLLAQLQLKAERRKSQATSNAAAETSPPLQDDPRQDDHESTAESLSFVKRRKKRERAANESAESSPEERPLHQKHEGVKSKHRKEVTSEENGSLAPECEDEVQGKQAAKAKKAKKNLNVQQSKSELEPDITDGLENASEAKKKSKKRKLSSEQLSATVDGAATLENGHSPVVSKKRKCQDPSTDDVQEIVESVGDENGQQKKSKKRRKKNKSVGDLAATSELPNGESDPKDKENRLDKLMMFRRSEQRKKAAERLQDELKLADNGEFTVIGEVMKLKPQQVTSILPDWLRNPTTFSPNLHENLTTVEKLGGLHPSIVSVLEGMEMQKLFPVQACVIPWLLRSIRSGFSRPSDICVSAPTGSGKTLTFVLPIVQALRSRVVRTIRALVVLPVHELAIQVFEVFKSFCGPSGLTVGLAVGTSTFAQEQLTLVRKGFRGYHSMVDILVCTPGHLVDHIKLTEGFTLKDLRFLVIDEADRMMEHIKQGWLQRVEECVLVHNAGCVMPITPARVADQQRLPQKLLFSATLSQDPEKLELMKLFQPKLFIAASRKEGDTFSCGQETENLMGKMVLPSELTQFSTVCNIELKPLVVLHLLHHLKHRAVVCFTNSLESSKRLFMLLSSFGSLRVVEFSSNMTAIQRRQSLNRFKIGLIDVIVCTDAMARGIDIENVQCVISYDVPKFIITYVHRVGRTARAGRAGTAITLLQPADVPKFTKMLNVAGIENVNSISVEESSLEPLVERYQAALDDVLTSVKTESIKKIKMSH